MADSEIAPEVVPSHRWRILDIAKQTWKSQRSGWLLWAGFVVLSLYWWWFVPSTGKAGMLLAVAAAIMSARAENLKGIAMGFWILLLFGLLFVEYRAIDKDKTDSQKALTDSFAKITEQANKNLKTTLDQSNSNLKNLLDDEHKSFAGILENQQNGFLTTLHEIVTNDRKENERFSELLSQQQKLFDGQLELSASLNGRLLPANDPPLRNACTGLVGKDEITVISTSSNNAYSTKIFPYTILQINGKRAVGITRKSDGSVVLLVDMRDTNGRVIFKLDESGLRGEPGIYLLRPNKSTVIVEDPFGDKLFSAKYTNGQTFVIDGVIIYGGQQYSIAEPEPTSAFIENCFSNSLVAHAIP